MLRYSVAQQVRYDEIEILHTDSATYIPLIFETLTALQQHVAGGEDELPLAVTFAEGIPCRYSRPGRALRLWLEWLCQDYPLRLLESMVSEGLLNLPVESDGNTGPGRLVRMLKAAAIGHGRERYLPQIEAEALRVQQRLATLNPTDDDTSRLRETLQRDLIDLQTLTKLVETLFDVTPAVNADATEILRAAQQFLRTQARSVNQMDRYAVPHLCDAIDEILTALVSAKSTACDVLAWLRELPATARILGSGPRPGYLHVDSIHGGGHSGRPHTWILGLDDSRFPGAGLPDPVLLDDERRALSKDLPVAGDRLDESVRRLVSLLARLRGEVTLSFSRLDLAQDRELFPSPVLVSAYRLLSGNREADQEAMLKSLPPAVSFAPEAEQACLDETEWWLWRMTTDKAPAAAEQLVGECFPHLARGKLAALSRDSAEFTAYDGAVPVAAKTLDPTLDEGRSASAHSLETLAACPRKFFFRYGLRIEPPDEPSAGTTWLDAAEFGSLLHRLFELFIRELAADHRVPIGNAIAHAYCNCCKLK